MTKNKKKEYEVESEPPEGGFLLYICACELERGDVR